MYSGLLFFWTQRIYIYTCIYLNCTILLHQCCCVGPLVFVFGMVLYIRYNMFNNIIESRTKGDHTNNVTSGYTFEVYSIENTACLVVDDACLSPRPQANILN